MTAGHQDGGRRTRGVRGSTELRLAIVEATDRMLMATGDQKAVSISAITRAAGCTPPSLYHYWPDKNALLREVCERAFAAFAAKLDAAVAGIDDPLTALSERGRAYFRYGLEQPEHYRLLFQGRPDGPSAAGGQQQPGAGLQSLIADVQAAMSVGAYVVGDPLPVAIGLWATVHGFTSLALANPAVPRALMADSLERAMTVYHRGLSPSGQSRPVAPPAV